MKWISEPVTVRAPATSANLGPGFDSLGLALSLYDTVQARVLPGGVEVQVTGVGAGEVGRGEEHLVVRAMRVAFTAMGAEPPGIGITCRNEVPQGFGLGSSAAAIVAGLLAGRALGGQDGATALPDTEVLRLACDIEGHPDNVAACLFGGLTVAWDSEAGVRVARLMPAAGLAPVVCVPAEPLATAKARLALPAQIAHAAAAANAARAALLIAGLTGRPELLFDGTEDFLHQPFRAAAMPATTALIGRLRSAGIAAVVSGAGPSVLALIVDGDQSSADTVAKIAGEAGSRWQILAVDVDVDGAKLLPG